MITSAILLEKFDRTITILKTIIWNSIVVAIKLIYTQLLWLTRKAHENIPWPLHQGAVRIFPLSHLFLFANIMLHIRATCLQIICFDNIIKLPYVVFPCVNLVFWMNIICIVVVVFRVPCYLKLISGVIRPVYYTIYSEINVYNIQKCLHHVYNK